MFRNRNMKLYMVSKLKAENTPVQGLELMTVTITSNMIFSNDNILRFEILAMKMSILIWVVMSCGLVSTHQHLPRNIFNPKDGNSMFLQSTGIYLQVHMKL
jgi:hypothetical protein